MGQLTWWVNAYGFVLFGWFALLAAGPARVLGTAMLLNGFALARQPPARQRYEQYETWMALPYVAYILSGISGVSVTLLFGENFMSGLALFGLGFAVIIGAWIFFGIRDPSSDYRLSEITDPNAFLSELKFRSANGVPEASDVEDMRHQQARLEKTPEPDWRQSIREDLCRPKRRLDASCAPKWRGVGKWRDLDDNEIKITSAMVLRASRHYWSVWAGLIAALIHILFFVGMLISATLAEQQPARAYVAVVIASITVLVVTMTTAYLAVRASLIAWIRLHLAENDYEHEIEEFISDLEDKISTSTEKKCQETELYQSLFEEICEVLIRRISTKQRQAKLAVKTRKSIS